MHMHDISICIIEGERERDVYISRPFPFAFDVCGLSAKPGLAIVKFCCFQCWESVPFALSVSRFAFRHIAGDTSFAVTSDGQSSLKDLLTGSYQAWATPSRKKSSALAGCTFLLC